MAYSDKYGSTDIFDKDDDRQELLSLNWDFQEDDSNLSERNGCFLYVPDKDNCTHYHIEFGVKEAKLVAKWMQDYVDHLESNDVKEVFVQRRDWTWSGTFKEQVLSKKDPATVDRWTVEDLKEISKEIGIPFSRFLKNGGKKSLYKELIRTVVLHPEWFRYRHEYLR